MKLMLLSASLVIAVPTTAHAADPSKKNPDPDRVICKTEDVVGSRLQKAKTCMTAQEWEDQKREQRQNLERAQTRH